MIIYWDTLEKNAADTRTIPEYIYAQMPAWAPVSGNIYWENLNQKSGSTVKIPDYIYSQSPQSAVYQEVNSLAYPNKFISPFSLINSFLNPVWKNYTPVHSRAGTNYTNLPTTNSARYLVVGKLAIVEVNFTQNAVPGGSSIMLVTTPPGYTPAVNTPLICWDGNSGKFLGGLAATSGNMALYLYDGNIECSASHIYQILAIYEVA